MYKENTHNPYHLIAEWYGNSDVYGWVRANDIQSLSDIDSAIIKLYNLKIINSPAYWMDFVKTNEVKYLSDLIIKSTKKVSSSNKQALTPTQGLSKLVSNGIISSPDYWSSIINKYANIGALIQTIAGAMQNVTEDDIRKKVVNFAKQYLGYNEWDGTHRTIIDAYNAHTPRARNYKVSYYDAWCATFVSFVSISLGYTDIMPTECGCECMIELYKKLGRWQENDAYIPKPGDIIFYSWTDGTNYRYTDLTDIADHVGIVTDCDGWTVTVIEGNKNDSVSYQQIAVNGRYIRGYAVPNYAKKI